MCGAKQSDNMVFMAFPKDIDKIGNKARKPLNGVKIPTETIILALNKSHGNISRAADRIGCCRDTLHSRINAEPAIKQVLDSNRERWIDDSEDVLREKVLAGDTASLLFFLKTQGKKRGYDMDRNVLIESTTRGVLDFIANRSKNPAES